MPSVTPRFKGGYNHPDRMREDATVAETPAAPLPDLPLPPSPLVEEIPGGLRIPMRAERSGCLLTFLTAWLFMWSIGSFMVVRSLFAAGNLAETLLLIVWLTAWAAFGMASAIALAFVLDGREIITIDGNDISRRAEIFGIGYTRHWSTATVSNFRAEKAFLSFDVAGKSVRAGTNLTNSSAERIAGEVVRRFPGLG